MKHCKYLINIQRYTNERINDMINNKRMKNEWIGIDEWINTVEKIEMKKLMNKYVEHY